MESLHNPVSFDSKLGATTRRLMFFQLTVLTLEPLLGSALGRVQRTLTENLSRSTMNHVDDDDGRSGSY